jgi:3-ketosteroid 9alpha-monooxygenase subunit B
MTARQPYRRIRVCDVITETPDALSLVLEVPPELAAEFAYRPGQFLTVRVPHEVNTSVARCYSLSSAPRIDEKLKITVKRVPDGHASNWICDRVVPGAVLEMLPPAGMFTPTVLDGDLLLLAGGSGITPIISILKSALAEGHGQVALVYANRDPGSAIFAAELSKLEARHPDRLQVRHWFDVAQGPPTVGELSPILRPYAGRDAFICGPEPYLAVARLALGELGVPAQRIHVERFQSLLDNPFEPEELAAAVGAGTVHGGPQNGPERTATAEIILDGQTHHLPWPATTRLLDLLISAGLNPPYSCRQGICGACACRIVRGEVELLHNEVLEEEDFAEGYTLACQALPRSDSVTVTYS